MTLGRDKINSLGQPLVQVAGTTVWFGAWPVRQEDFAVFAAETEYDASDGMLTLGPTDDDWSSHGFTWNHPGFAQTPEHPVVGVSWHDAQAFCQWLTRRERHAKHLAPGWHYRLPTDREWSTAIGLPKERGGTPEERLYRSSEIYPWGASWPPPENFGNYAGEESRVDMPSWWGVAPGGYRDPFPRTSPVGSFPANAAGLYDLSGNVWEWCEDRYSAKSLSRVTRGGSWGSDRPNYLLSANRTPRFPDLRTDEIGFRVVLARK
jgi:formylglycine-generating enzyme required for sulfatase activity